ncbi:MAG: acetolactate synthase small subunit [Gemmatimonadaceae bacterium]
MQHTLIALLQDQPGVLNRAVSLFRRRAFNIASLSVGQSETPGVSRMTLVVDREYVEQVVKQLDRLIEVLAVHDITHERTVEQETCLVKVTASNASLADLVRIARESGARIVEVSAGVMILALTDAPQGVATFVERMRPFGIVELIQSGRIAMALGSLGSRDAVRERSRDAERALLNTHPFRWQADGTSDDEAA